MWVNPKYAGTSTPRESAPRDDGRRLATFERGQGQELRVRLCRYEGHDYIDIRLFQGKGPDAFPVKGRGVTVRMGEVAELAEVLAAIGSPGRVETPAPRMQTADGRDARGPRVRPDWRDASLAPITGGDGAFDEFEGEA